MRLFGRGLVALLLGTLAALGVIEGVLRVFPQIIASDSLKRELRWRRTHVFVTRAPDNPFVSSPELGWDLRPNYRSVRINTNATGLRGLREYAPEPPSGVRRVLCVGDSFTFGEKLSDEEALPARLEAALNRGGRWEVLNLGVPGYGTDQQWLRLQRLGFRYGADVVVLGFFEDNIRRNIMSFRDYAKPYFGLSGGELVLRNVPVPSPEQLLTRPPSGPSTPRVRGVAHRGRPGLRLSVTRREAHAGRSRHGGDPRRHAPVGVESGHAVRVDDDPAKHLASRTEELLVRWAARTRTPLVNLREVYRELPEADRASLYASHWTPYGAALTASALAEQVRTAR